MYLAIAIAFGAERRIFRLKCQQPIRPLFIVSRFATPRIAQEKVLLFGIVLGLAARTGFILGARPPSGRPDAEATVDGLG
jgi:hypothetical protein